MEVIHVDNEEDIRGHQMVDLTVSLPTHGEVSRQVLEMFPLVEREFLEDLIQRNIALPDPVLRICDLLLTTNYPKTKHKEQSASSPPCTSVQTPPTLKDPTRHFTTKLTAEAAAQSYTLLSRDYPHIAANELRFIVAEHNYHYAAAKRHVDDCLSMKMVTLGKAGGAKACKPTATTTTATTDFKMSSTGKRMHTLQLISRARGTSSLPPSLDPQLALEVEFVQRNQELYLPKGVDRWLLSNLQPNKRSSVRVVVPW